MPRQFKLAITILGITLLSAGVVWCTNSRAASDPTALALTTAPEPALARFVDTVRGFSFDYPGTLTLTVTDDGDDHAIFGDAADGETRLMIVAFPYLLDQPLTEDIIRAQPFAAQITSPIDRRPLPSGTTAFLFQRIEPPLPPTRDALIVERGTTYQISVVADFEDLFNQILQSWRFASPTPL